MQTKKKQNNMSNPEKAENFHCGTSICHIEKKKGFEQLEKNRKKTTHIMLKIIYLFPFFFKAIFIGEWIARFSLEKQDNGLSGYAPIR